MKALTLMEKCSDLVSTEWSFVAILLCVGGVYFCFTAFSDPAVSKNQYVSVMWYVTSFEWERSNGEVLWLGGRCKRLGEEHEL